MAFDEVLATRVRPLFSRKKGVSEMKMFGGLGFLLNGNMCVGVWKKYLILRLGRKRYDDALRQPFVKEFDRHVRCFMQPLAELPRLVRLLTLLAAEMHGQADDKSDDPFLRDQPLEPPGIGLEAAAGVVLNGAGNADLKIGHRQPNTHSSIVDTHDTAASRRFGFRWIIGLVAQSLSFSSLRRAVVFILAVSAEIGCRDLADSK